MNTPSELLSLLQALEAFDIAIAPVGLYAAEEYQLQDKPRQRLEVEWGQCLKPAMEAMGCKPIGRVFYEPTKLQFSFRMADASVA